MNVLPCGLFRCTSDMDCCKESPNCVNPAGAPRGWCSVFQTPQAGVGKRRMHENVAHRSHRNSVWGMHGFMIIDK